MKRFVLFMVLVFGVMVGQAFGQNLDLLTKEEQAEVKTLRERLAKLVIEVDGLEKCEFLDFYVVRDEADMAYQYYKDVLLELNQISIRIDELLHKTGMIDTKIQPLLMQIAIYQVKLETSYLNAQIRIGN
jgi:hypothetical protein